MRFPCPRVAPSTGRASAPRGPARPPVGDDAARAGRRVARPAASARADDAELAVPDDDRLGPRCTRSCTTTRSARSSAPGSTGRAPGNSPRETWAEIWDEIGPLFRERLFAGEAVWNVDQRLLVNRNGYEEEAFFTYSYSPIHDDSDVVAGLLVVATETTAQVVDRRRLSCIGDLAGRSWGHIDRVGGGGDDRRVARLSTGHRGGDRFVVAESVLG